MEKTVFTFVFRENLRKLPPPQMYSGHLRFWQSVQDAHCSSGNDELQERIKCSSGDSSFS